MQTYYAYPYPTYQPALRLIASISQAFPAVITTTFNHQYTTGTIVRLDIPPANKMIEADQFFGPITVTSPTTFTLNLDTTHFDPFVSDGSAQVIPMGEVSSLLSAATQNVLPY